jgi:hypothetical protein
MQFGVQFNRGRQNRRGVALIKVVLGFIAFAAFSTNLIRAETALQAGEELTYSVRWAVLPAAGQIQISAGLRDKEGSPQLSIITSTETRGLAKSLMTFQARSESTFDLRTGRMVALHESSVARAKRTEYSVDFDYRTRRAIFTPKAPEAPRALDLPEGDPADLITTLMKTRLWDLEVGQSRDVLVSYRDDFYDLTIYATRTEKVKTPLGRFDAVVLEPRMEKTPPKGMFKRGANVRVWVSRDEARLPVRFQVEFKVGTGVATLVKYHPPASSADVRVAAYE